MRTGSVMFNNMPRTCGKLSTCSRINKAILTLAHVCTSRLTASGHETIIHLDFWWTKGIYLEVSLVCNRSSRGAPVIITLAYYLLHFIYPQLPALDCTPD